MTKRLLSVAVGILFAAAGALGVEVNFCAVPENCVDDKLKVVFAATGTSELSKVTVGQEIEVHVLLDVKSPKIQGFSYGVTHDPEILEIISVTHKGASDVIVQAEFKTTKIAQDKSGFLQAVVVTLDEEPPFELPIEDNLKLASATYKVLAVPEEVSTICFSGAAFGSKQPRTVECAILTGGAALTKFSRGDTNGDGRINITDAIVAVQNIFLGRIVLFNCDDMLDANDDGRLDTPDPVFLLNHLFRSGPPLPLPFQSCGPDGESDALRCKQPNCG